ncbi:sensor histidine kinase [Glacieibacterium frigidum]|uniref:sensor histidine kinase n=1 Tax=Glacieibacterium frigidum TaxID=2593303 RepID=UPI00163D7F87|nr:PAS domain S-box protein [Glacieibacterium frigidum]
MDLPSGLTPVDGLRPQTEASFAADPNAGLDFRLMADLMPTPCWMANADGYIFWYNRRFYDYTGTTPDQMAGWGWRSIHDPDMLPAVMAKWTGAIERGERFEMTFPLRAADGSFRPFLTRVEPVRNANGTVVRWYGVNSDVSGEVQLETRLSESEAALRAFFETTGIYTAIIDLDPDDFTFVLANRRMARFWGADGVTGRTARDLSGGRLPRSMMPAMHAAHVSGKPTTLEYPFNGPDGDRWFTATLTPMPTGRGGKPRLSIVSLDITARKDAEAALAQALETKDTLLHEVNHRVKNSLQLVTALLSLQAAQAREPALRSSLIEARGRVSVVASMHQRLYSTSAHDRVDLVSYLRELSVESAAAHGSGIALDFTADDELVLPLTIAVPLALVVSELLTNAFKYAFPGAERGTVRVTVHVVDGKVCLIIADDGVGLPPDFNLARAGSLGMKIVRSLTRQVGGTVEIEDNAPGAKFTVCAPTGIVTTPAA